MTTARHQLRNVKGTPDFGIEYKTGSCQLKRYCDVSCGADLASRESTNNGYLLFLPGGLLIVSFKPIFLKVTAQTASEGELNSVELKGDGIYLTNMLSELTFEKELNSAPLFGDKTVTFTLLSTYQTYRFRTILPDGIS